VHQTNVNRFNLVLYVALLTGAVCDDTGIICGIVLGILLSVILFPPYLLAVYFPLFYLLFVFITLSGS